MRDDFLEAMSRAANSVYVVTTDGVGGRVGVTVSAVTSVSADAPSVLICVHHASPAAAAIRRNAAFCVNLLAEGQAEISDSFAGLTGARGEEKFACASWKKGATGCPVLSEPLAAFDCELVHDLRVGSHHVFVGELRGVEVSGQKSPLIHTNRSYGKTAPIDRRP